MNQPAPPSHAPRDAKHRAAASKLMRGMSLLVLGAVCAACSAPPSTTQASPFEWTVVASELDDAVLSVCAGGDRLVAVGGAVGQAAVFEWNGAAWRGAVMPAGTELLWWCWIDDDGRAYAVGDKGSMLTSDAGSEWSAVDLTGVVPGDVTLYGIWGSSATNIIAVGGAFRPAGNVAVAIQFDGTRWSQIESGALPDQVLFKVWGSSDTDLWIVGTGGTILHSDGASWTSAASPTTERLIAVWGTSTDNVFAVGGDASGLVLRFDGAAWTQFDTTVDRLSGVWTEPEQPLYVAGDRGYVARYELGVAGSATAANPAKRTSAIALASVDFHSLTSIDGVIVASGSDLIGGNNSNWRGAVATHNGTLAGQVIGPAYPDAGPVDAADADQADATQADAMLADAAPPDAPAPDALPLPGAGELCGEAPNFCAEGLTCWRLLASGVLLCTESCIDSSRCKDPGYGPTLCCVAPGPQTLETVCIPGNYGECGS